jgi:hypothetical protein
MEFARRCDIHSFLRCLVHAFKYLCGIPDIVLEFMEPLRGLSEETSECLNLKPAQVGQINSDIDKRIFGYIPEKIQTQPLLCN